MLQPDQRRVRYACLTKMAMLALFQLLMPRAALASTLILHLNPESGFLVQPLLKSVQNVTFVAIPPMALMRTTLITSPSLIMATFITSLRLILLTHSLKSPGPMKKVCRSYWLPIRLLLLTRMFQLHGLFHLP